jgi:hypothetical protein
VHTPGSSTRSTLLADPHQLLLDDWLIARRSGLTRRLGKPQRHAGNPVLVPTEPHEGAGILMFGTLVQDGGRYRCWYYTVGDGEHFCYAESEDGLEWVKPHLGLVEWHGSRANNILYSVPKGWRLANCSVSRSAAEPDPERRYRAVLFMRTHAEPVGSERGHYLSYSADGIHWSEPRFIVRCNECGGLLWDESRTDLVDLNKTGHGLHMLNREDLRVGELRCTAVASSEDGQTWPPHYRVALVPNPQLDQPTDEFYHLHGYRWGGAYVGYLRVYHNTPDSGAAPRQRLDIQLATSRDGQTWERVCPGEHLLQSAVPRQWDFGRLAIGNGPPVCVGDTMRIYYCGQATDHRGGDGMGGQGENGLGQGYTAKVGFACLRRDGFASLDADTEGELVTHPLAGGRQLALNLCAAQGRCLVELQDAAGGAIPGYSLEQCTPLTGDQLSAPVTWQGHGDGALPDGAFRLRIVLERARLFAWDLAAGR